MTPVAFESLSFRGRLAKGSSTATNLASAGFLLLFPGFLLYHYGISVGWWGAVFGGLFGGGAALVGLLACSAFQKHGGIRQSLSFLKRMALGTLVYMVGWSLFSSLGILNSPLAAPIMVEAIATVVIWIAMLFIGSYLTTSPAALMRLSVVGIAVAILCFGHAFYTGGFPSGPYLAFTGTEEGGQVTYQGIGRSLLAICLIAAFANRHGYAASLLILLGGGFLMLSLGSRAHLFVVGVSVLIHLIVLLAIRRTRVIGLIGLLLTAGVLGAVASVFLETRAAEILDLASSASWQDRVTANSRALEVIAGHPLAGKFGYYFWDSAGYAHNILSAWTQYGLLGFVAFIATSACALFIAFKGLLVSRGREPAWHLAFHFNLVAIVLAIASEPIMSSVFPPLAWGLTLRAQHVHRTAIVASRS